MHYLVLGRLEERHFQPTFEGRTMTNCDANGIRYSYFSFNELADWCNEDLFYGSQARDLSYQEALQELKAEAEAKFDDLLDQAEIAAAEVDPHMVDRAREQYIEDFFEERNVYRYRSDFIDDYVEHNAERIQIDEPIIEGELDGVSYRISWLGGAPNIFVFKGPIGYGNQLCSPCVPGAVQGGGGFTLEEEAGPDPDGYKCYCVPRDWLRKEEV